MKIVAILESSPPVGGGFNQALTAIRQMQRLCMGRFDFRVLTTKPENLQTLAALGIPSDRFKYSILDSLLAVLSLNVWWQSIQARLKLTGPFEKELIRTGCDLVYFVSPTEKSSSLQQLNFIATVWDTCHRDMPEFPEVRAFHRLHARERYFRHQLSPALLTLTDSEASALSLERRYGIDRERLLPMPFSPAPLLATDESPEPTEILRKYSLDPGYFFYPAQFWAHKNHVRILEALVRLNAAGFRPIVVFSGGNQGNRGHVEGFARRNGLDQQVRFLDFVPAEDMPGLYRGCQAVVMPTYFGPTNLPPLEAWVFGKPLIYSSLFSEHVGNAAILVDPDDSASLAAALKSCLDIDRCSQLIANGKRRLQEVQCERLESERRLLKQLEQFEKRLRCWQ
jgi:glycosyltransferase involved in cell wall biosynthesis